MKSYLDIVEYFTLEHDVFKGSLDPCAKPEVKDFIKITQKIARN